MEKESKTKNNFKWYAIKTLKGAGLVFAGICLDALLKKGYMFASIILMFILLAALLVFIAGTDKAEKKKK
jgi:hypothetical protein